MKFKVSLHEREVIRLEKMVTILNRQELLVTGFYTFYVEADLTPAEFWKQWRGDLDI